MSTFDELVPSVKFKSVGTATTAIASAATSTTIPSKCYTFTVEANSANSGIVFLGASDLSSTLCIHLAPGDSFSCPPINLSAASLMQYDLTQWFLKASAASQKVTILKTVKGAQLS